MNKDEILRKDLTALLRLIRSTANPDNLPETTLGRKAMFTSILTYAYTAESLLEVRDGVRKGAMERVRAAKALRAEQRSAKPDELPTTEQPREKPEPDMPTSVGPRRKHLPTRWKRCSKSLSKAAPENTPPPRNWLYAMKSCGASNSRAVVAVAGDFMCAF